MSGLAIPPAPAGRKGWPWEPSEAEVCSIPTNIDDLPVISIVTPSYNQGELLEATIRSVLLQGYPRLEYIIIDAESNDNSLEVIRRYEPWLSYWVSEPDNGQAEAINKGFSHSRGDWLGWLNSDDLYLPGALWQVAIAILADKRHNWLVGTTLFVDEKLSVFGRFDPKCDTDRWLDFVCTKCCNGTALPQQSSFWSRRVWERVGSLNEGLHFAMDHEYWGRLAQAGFRPLKLPQEIALFRQHGSSKTAEGKKPFYKEELEVVGGWVDKVVFREACYLRWYRMTFPLRIWWQSRRKDLRQLFGRLLKLT
jgi:glycosyltransferase involved in cell wall biosynthesis